MRIAFISYEYPPVKGGIGTYVRQIAKAMADIGWDIHVFTAGDAQTDTEFSDGYYVHRVLTNNPHDFKYDVLKAFAIQQDLQDFDIIESPEIHGNALEIKKKYPKLPLIVRLHAPDSLVESLKKTYISFISKLRFVFGSIRRFKFDRGYWRPYDRFNDNDYKFIQYADLITAPSEAMKKWAVNNWQVPANKIVVIPNIFSAPQALLNIPIVEEVRYKRIIFFGRLNVLKGVVNATIAMKKILMENPDWQFRVIGDDGLGPNNHTTMRNWMKGRLKKVIERAEFMDGVAYENLSSALSSCEIVLLPSLFESFSYTCAEAMAAGKAIVGSNNGGMADLMVNGKSGALINPYHHHEIYAAVKKLIEDDTYRVLLSKNARERITSDFNAQKSALNYKSFYEKIVVKEFAKNESISFS